ncbi:MAG: BT_3928 family protein [Catalinimonas sp.]
MNIITQIFRYATGLLFIFSGLIKLNDPVGTQIKFEEYFEVFAVDFAPFFHTLVPLALPLALVLCVAEVVLGVALLLQFEMRLTTWALLLLIGFFTFLTFYSAAFDKVTDCGCFGDAVKLTPWQSFTKDVVLLVMIAVLFARRKHLRSRLPAAVNWSALGVVTALSFAVGAYAIRYLPPLDFRAYRVGADLPALMEPSAALKYSYVMLRDGRQEVLDAYPTDTAYVYKDIILRNPEALPKITDYRVWNDEGDFTEATFEGKKLLIVIHSAEDTKLDRYPAVRELVEALPTDVEPMVLTAADRTRFEALRHEVQLAVPYYFADGTVLKTMIRNNPGLILLEEGVVVDKWSPHRLPTAEGLTTAGR